MTVVIPVKDDARQLRRCLRALALQTRRADEILIVDNGSSDASARVAGEAGATVVQCVTPGISAASAQGYDLAHGDIVLRLDADCLPSTTWVAVMVEAFQRNPHVAAFTGGARFVDGPRLLRAPLAAVYLGAYAAAMFPALGHLPLFGSNMGFRRTAWRSIRSRVHRRDTELHDDLDLSYHLGEWYRIRLLPRAAVGMSMRPFADRRAFARRVANGFRTVVVHWPQDFPPVRWAKLILRRTIGPRTFRAVAR
ncbi:glycosyltransferase family A protein [Microbacterium sp. P01]|uniref:glycosyltransferase family A protein n=1 Tax=unclassified Microbacterium TaxID=2609290 RepID=UPI00366E9FEB